jgi:hypothetical protein
VREAVGDGVVQVLVSHVSHIAEDVHNSPGRPCPFTPFSSISFIYAPMSWIIIHAEGRKVVAICMTMFCVLPNKSFTLMKMARGDDEHIYKIHITLLFCVAKN